MPKQSEPAAGGRPRSFLSNVVRRYFQHDVGRQAAALAYYLLFTLFPLMIFVSSLLGLLQLDVNRILAALHNLLPAGVLDVVEAYLIHVSRTSSPAMLWFGLVFTIYFPMRAADCLMRAVRRAYHLPQPKNLLIYQFKVLLYTVFLLFAIAVTLFLATVGQRILLALGDILHLPMDFITLWDDMRFVIVAVVMFAAVGLLYAVAQDTRQHARAIVPGTVAALAGWLLVSGAYSYYVENFAHYSVIYGTLGTVIVLLVWLNLTAIVLIMGAEINGAILSLRREKAAKHGNDRRGGAEGENTPGEERDL